MYQVPASPSVPKGTAPQRRMNNAKEDDGPPVTSGGVYHNYSHHEGRANNYLSLHSH